MKKSPWILVAGLVSLAAAVYYFFLRKGAGPAAGKTAAAGSAAAAGKGNALMQAVPNVLDRLINPTATRANNGDIQLTNAKGEVTGTVPGGLIDSVFGLFRSNKPAASGSPAAPAAAAAAPDAYAGLDSTGVAVADASEDLASGQSVQDQADWLFGDTQADMQPTAADENWVDYQPDSQYLDAWA